MMLGQVFVTEFLKLRRCKVTWFSFAALSMGPLGIALFMWIAMEPDRAARLGLLGKKADLLGVAATWPSFFSLLTMVVGLAGMLLLAFIVAYVFGREYAEGTAKNMLAVPVGRHWFVLAKFAVSLLWWVMLVLAILSEAFVVGSALRLPGLTAEVALHALHDTLLAAGIAYLLVPVTAWITTYGRGYMPPLAFALSMLALGNVVSKTGWADWFPWSIVPMIIGMVGKPVDALPSGSLVVVIVTFLVGIAATAIQVRYADNAQ